MKFQAIRSIGKMGCCFLATASLFLAGCKPTAFFHLPMDKNTLTSRFIIKGSNGAPSHVTEASQLFNEAWRTVSLEFVDGSYNGQDWRRWEHRYDNKIKDDADVKVAIDTMLASLGDHYTRYLPPRDMNEQTMQIDSRLYGIGIQIAMKDNKLVVIAPLDDTPAAKAGIQPGDLITQINGKSTAGMTVEEAADRIRGEEGTCVRLRIHRLKTFDLSLSRAEIKIKSVFTRAVKYPEIGYIRLNSFISETTIPEMEQALDNIKNKKALILDIRGNYGGLLSNAVEIADMFLESGDIVSIVGRQHDKRVFRASRGERFTHPIILLIDGGSASASEILSGALKDHHRATLVGTKTFGKGLVQKINPLEDGSGINITISKYLTPNGTDINKKGIEPDVKVLYTEDNFIKNQDPQLDKALWLARQQEHQLTARGGP